MTQQEKTEELARILVEDSVTFTAETSLDNLI